MITSAIHDQSSATEALRSDVTSRIQDDAAAALEARESLRSSVEAIKQQITQVRLLFLQCGHLIYRCNLSVVHRHT